MKYFLLNQQEIKDNIWTNPILVKTKNFTKVKKLRTLQKQLDSLLDQINKELYESNSGLSSDIIQTFLNSTNTEITSKEYNTLKVMSLLDTQEQRIKICNKTNVLKGKLYGNQIKG